MTSARHRFSPAALAVLLLMLGAGAPGAQEPDPIEPPEGVFFESVDVNLVNVDVHVTDKKGNRVPDLTIDDFEIYENGRPMKITNFYAVEDGRRRPPEGGVEAPRELPVDIQAPDRLDPLALPEDQRLSLILYFDNMRLRPFNRNKVAGEIMSFLHRHVGRDDQVMLVTFERSLHIRQPFTSDLSDVRLAIDGILKLSALGVQAGTDRRDVIRRIEHSRDELDALSQVDFYAKSTYDDVVRSIRGMKDLVSSLAGLPGRKAFLYVSDGIPMTAAEDLFYLVNQKHTDGSNSMLRSRRYSARSRYRELTAHANANRVTFYTIEAQGNRPHDSLSADSTSVDGSMIDIDGFRQLNLRESQMMMAEDTGGQAVFGTNNFDDALDRVAEDLKSFYSLGYTPAHRGDGRYHTIEVRLKRKGLRVRHRAGYRDKTRSTRMTEGTLASLLFGVEANPLEVLCEAQRPTKREDGRYLVPFLVRIPLGKITFVPIESIHRSNLQISVAVIDDENELSPVDLKPLPITVPESDFATAVQQYYVYEVELLMEKGRQIVAVGVQDEIAGQTSYVRTPVEIGS